MSREIVIHNIDLTTTRGILTGGAKCMVEIIRYFSKKYKNILYTCDSTGVAFSETLKLKGEKIEYKLMGRYYFENSYYCYFINFFRIIYFSFFNIPKFDKKNVNIIVTHSEIFATVLFGLLMKIKNKNSFWVSFMHMPAPRLFSGYKGEYTKRKYFPTIAVLHFWLNQRAYNFLAKKADLVIATNPLYKENLLKNFGRVRIIHYGIELPAKQVDFIQNVNYEIKEYEALFVGRVHVQKGIFELLDIWGRVIKRNNKFKLALVGSGLDKNNKELVKKIKKMGLENNIDLLGYKVGVEKDRIMQKSKVFLFPSLYESFGIVALEAMSYGLPVIAYNLPVFEIFSQSMIKVPILDNEKFVEELFKLLNDNLYYKRKSNEVRAYSMRFTWEKTGKQFESIIDDILRNDI